MSNNPLRGPTITYVTDEELDFADQQRILREFIACAPNHTLRVAFRIPAWSDTIVLELLEWYTELVDDTGMRQYLEPFLIHDRPELTALFPQAALWLPWRNRDLIREEDLPGLAISVHDSQQAEEAQRLGASELVFGHVFTSESHPGEPGRGVPALQTIIETMRQVPDAPRITAIGGINHFTMPALGRIQFGEIATVRAISRSGDIPLTLKHMDEGWRAASIAAEIPEHGRSHIGRPTNMFF